MIPHAHSKYHRKNRTTNTTVSTQRSSLRNCLAQHHSWSRPANKIAHVHSLLVFFHTHIVGNRQRWRDHKPKIQKEQHLHTRKQRTKHISSYSKSDIASSQFQSIWQAINIPSHKKLNSWLSTVQDPQHTSRFFDRSLDKACTVQVTLALCSNILTTKTEPPDTASLEKS